MKVLFRSWYGSILSLSVLACAGSPSSSPRVSAPPAAVPTNPFVGVWKFDPTRSRLIAEKIQYQIADAGKLRFSNASGSNYEFAIDGRDYPTSSNRTIAWASIGPRQWETTFKIGGKVTETARQTLSADGQTLDVLAEGALPNGMTYQHKKRYVRTGNGEGLAGTWRNLEVDTQNMPDGYVLSENASGVVTWAIPTDNQTLTGRFDGSEMPLMGATAPPGTTFSVHRVADRKLVYTMKVHGKIGQHGAVTVSDDGQTLIEESWPPGGESEKSTGFFSRLRCPPRAKSGPPRATPDKRDPNWLCEVAP